MSKTSGSDGPEDVDATFAEIVAGLRAEGVGDDNVRQPDDPPPEADTEQAAEPPADPGPRRATASGTASGWRDSESGWDETMFGPASGGFDDEEEYVPPEPPPLPKPRRGAFIVMLFFVVGLLLLIAPTVLGLNDTIGTPLGMLALATGIALLLLRVRHGPPDGADPDNGAQV